MENAKPPLGMYQGGSVVMTMWRTVLLAEGVVAGTFSKVVVIGLDVFGQVKDFAACTFGARTIVRDVNLALFKLMAVRGFFFSEDSFVWAFGDASTAVDAGVGVDIVPRPFIFRDTGYNAFNRANFNASAVT
jgi:hypothetical protein